MILTTVLVSTVLSSVATTPSDDQWPGWRGADGSGLAAGSPPIEWSEDKNVRWKLEIPGLGSSSPVVWGDRIFLTSAVPTGKRAEGENEGEGEGEAESGNRGRGRGGDERQEMVGQEPGGRERGGQERGGQERGGQERGGQERGRGRGGFGRTEPIVEQEFVVLAVDRADGSVVWQKTASTQMPHQSVHRDGTYASPTLVTDGEVLIAYFGSYGIYAYTLDGEPLWDKDLGDMNITRSFGEGSSPVLHDDRLVIAWDNDGDSFVVALNKKTGKEIWRTERELGTIWGTPLVVEVKGKPQVILCSARTIAYSLKSGKELWTHGQGATGGGGRGGGDREGRGGGRGSPSPGGGVISSPIFHQGVLVFSTGSRRGSFYGIHVEAAKGDIGDGEAVLWTSEGDTPHVPSPVAHDGILYSLKQNSGLLSAFDVFSGERIYGPERMTGLADAYASPVVADGRIYFVGRDGTSEVITAGKEFESLAVNVLDDRFDASPAVVGNDLYLRGRKHLYCIAETE